jgi:hypothetical protein
MKRWHRVAAEVLGPPLLAAVILFGVVVLSELSGVQRSYGWAWAKSLLSYLLLYIVFAYLIAGIPSVIYALVMEWVFARGLNPTSACAVALSSALGALSGAAMIAVLHLMSDSSQFGAEKWLVLAGFSALGLVVGAIMGVFVRWRTRVNVVRRGEKEI